MKKKVYRDKYGNKVVVLGCEKPEIIPFEEGGFTIDKNGDIKEVRVKPKKKKKSDK